MVSGHNSRKGAEMDEKQSKKISNDLDVIKKLLALQLRTQNVRGDLIANALGVSEARLSQMIAPKKRGKKTFGKPETS